MDPVPVYLRANIDMNWANEIRVILFLDEIDTVAFGRDGGAGCDGEIARTTGCIMQEINRPSGSGIIIAATDRKDLLDPALQRRFSIRHEVVRAEKEEQQKIAAAFWDVLSIQPPFSIAEYAGNDYTPSCIHTDMVKELAAYLETHPEDTPVEAAVEHEIIIPAHRAETFLLATDKLRMPDKPCAKMEKTTVCIARIFRKRRKKNQREIPQYYVERGPRGNHPSRNTGSGAGGNGTAEKYGHEVQ